MGNCTSKNKSSDVKDPSNHPGHAQSYVDPIHTVVHKATGVMKSGMHVVEKAVHAPIPRLKNIFAAPIEYTSNFVAPIFKKNSKDHAFLQDALIHNFIFTSLEKKEMNSLLLAFEAYEVKAEENIITQGEMGDYFYIIQNGSVDFLVDDVNVGSAGSGKTFGDLALLYNCPRAATVVATKDCKLWRVDQKVFRSILASNTISTDKDIKSILKKVPFLESMEDEYLNTMAYAATPEHFSEGDIIFQRGGLGDKFYVIQEGHVTVKDIEVGGKKFADQELGSGDYFGERAIVKDEPRAATVTANCDTSVLVLSREDFLKVLGNLEDLILKSNDVRKLKAMLAFNRSNVRPSEFSALTNLIKDVTFTTGTTVFTAHEEIKGAIYLVRSGKVTVTNVEEETTAVITAGGLFGEQSIHGETYTHIRTAVVDEECVCGKLTEVEIYSVLRDRKRLYNPWRNIDHIEEEKPGLNKGIKLEDLEKHRILGVGTFGKVWLVSQEDEKKVKTPFALKIQRKRQLLDHQQVDGVFREIKIMSELDHPFILKLINIFQDDASIIMLLQIVQGGELFGVMKRSPRKRLPEIDCKFYSAGILEGLSHMHHQKILYRDLKPENVLIDSDGYPVIVDLGFAKEVPDKTFTLCGTPWYIAPEVILGRGHDKGCDYWSWAIMLHEMITSITPFHAKGTDQMTLFKAIVHGRYKLERVSKEASDLIKRILVTRPSYRLGSLAGGSMDIKNHPFFKDIHFDSVFEKSLEAPWKPTLKDPLDCSDFDNWDHMNVDEKERALTGNEQKKFEKFDTILS